MIRISNISFFRFCWKNGKLDWPKCARTLDTSGWEYGTWRGRGGSFEYLRWPNQQLIVLIPRALGHFSKAHGGANKERLPFVWKTRLFRGEFK